MPAAAHTSSAAPPGAPETPMPPRIDPPASITRPPPTATMRGKCRMPDIASPDRDAFSISPVLVRNETADHALFAETSIVCAPA